MLIVFVVRIRLIYSGKLLSEGTSRYARKRVLGTW